MIQLGIDVGKSKIDLCLLPDGPDGRKKTKVLSNGPRVAAAVLEWVVARKVNVADLQVVLEPTGTYHEHLAFGLYDQGVRVVIANPARVRNFANGMGILTKTDRVDAFVLACYGELRKPEAWNAPPKEISELKALLTRRDALLKDAMREDNRLEKILSTRPSPLVETSVRKMIAVLYGELNAVEKLIDEHINRYPGLKRDLDLLTSIKGVGRQIGPNMLVALKSHDFESAQQAAAWFGLVPKEKRSGTSVHYRARLSKNGPAHLRAKLFIGALVAVKHNKPMKALYERLQASGKCKMSALGAVMRKLVHQCFGVLKHQRCYDENYGAVG